MLERFKRNESTPLDVQIARVIEEMGTYGPDSPEYKQMIKYLERLHKLKAGERREPVKMDTILTVGANVLIVFIVVGYERNHVMITRALDFIRKANR